MRPIDPARAIVALAAACALLTPALLLHAGPGAAPLPPAGRPPPLVVRSGAALDGIAAERLFAAPPQATDAPADDADNDAPDLAGVVGRFPGAATAMVRIGGGHTQTLSVGGTVDGWRLELLTPDRATFVKGSRRVVRGVK